MNPASMQEWKAHWVWVPADDPACPNTYAYFRKEFEFGKTSEPARLSISADTYYRVFINGQLAGWGPAMTEPRWQSFDTYDVSDLLKPGTNVIAAVVHHFGNAPENMGGNTNYWSRGGFLCQVDGDGKSEPMVTDMSWKCLESRVWKRDAPKIDRMSFSEMYDSRLEPVGWFQPGFDDSSWLHAEAVQLNPLVAEWNWNPKPSAVFPWLKLEPRIMDYFVLEPIEGIQVLYEGEVLERAEPTRASDMAVRMSLETVKPFQYTQIENLDALVSGDTEASAIIHPMQDGYSYDDFPGIHDPACAIDVGKLINGRIRLDIETNEGAIIEIGYSQILIDDRVIPQLSHRTPLADQFICREGRQSLETFNWRNFRYVVLTFRNLRSAATLHGLKITAERYPFERIGRFESNDEMLNWTWKACIDTTELCIHDRFMDNPSRERREYAGDLLSLTHGVYAAFGKSKAIDKYHSDLCHAYQAYGLVPHTVMGNRWEMYSIYVESPLELILNIDQHYELFGDRRVVQTFYPMLRESLELVRHYADDEGFLSESPFTMFVDWADLERRGTPLISNALLVGALRAMSGMADVLGQREESEQFRSESNTLATKIQARFWNEEKGFYSDAIVGGEQSPHTSEHNHFLMMLFGLASDDQCQRIELAIRNPDLSVGQVEPSFIWATEGLFKRGYADWAVELIRRRYHRFRKQGLETVGELWSLLGERFTGRWRSRDSRSAAQGSGVSAAYLLSRYVLGIQPAAPGFEEILISPQTAGLESARGVWPSPMGDISVEWMCLEDQRFQISYVLPKGIPGFLAPPVPFTRDCEWTCNGERFEDSIGNRIPISRSGTLVANRRGTQ